MNASFYQVTTPHKAPKPFKKTSKNTKPNPPKSLTTPKNQTPSKNLFKNNLFMGNNPPHKKKHNKNRREGSGFFYSSKAFTEGGDEDHEKKINICCWSVAKDDIPLFRMIERVSWHAEMESRGEEPPKGSTLWPGFSDFFLEKHVLGVLRFFFANFGIFL